MVGSLESRRTDPNYRRGVPEHRVKKDRGAGLYYHRGNGQYSKYSDYLDGIKKTDKVRTKNVKKAQRKQPHMHDYLSHKRKSSRLGRGGEKGWY